jgi:hypothetical protein
MTLDQKFWVGDGWMAGEERYKIAYWNWEVHGMESGPIQLTLRLSLFSPWVVAGNTLITFLRIAMARKGVSLVHASSVERNGQAWIFSGRSGAGKTLTALRALETGWRLLGDDSCLVSEGGVKGYWQPLNLRGTYTPPKMIKNALSPILRLERKLKGGLSKLSFGFIRLFTTLPPNKLGDCLSKGGKIAGWIFLKGGRSFSKRILSPEEALQTLMANQSFESREGEALLEAYVHVHPASTNAIFIKQETERLAAALRKVPVFEITIPKEYRMNDFQNLMAVIEGRIYS